MLFIIKNMEEYMLLKEIAEILKVHVITVRRWVIKGRLPAYLLGKDYRVAKSDFEKFMNDRRVKS
jgi:excisionase family DNA binding protein